MDDLFESEMNDRAEIERLAGVVEDMRRAGIKLRNQLSDFVEAAMLDNADVKAFPMAQDAIQEWNDLIKQSDLAWKEEIIIAPGSARLKLFDEMGDG